ncbi:DUF4145 domain-containing protein [Microbacterium sp. KR10-403]|uniref:DUF4145 domain-containing protein n=1 Tax=Microbacterium sp. KR10-403 TaxID=3158581 RepID=UPI0032E4701D
MVERARVRFDQATIRGLKDQVRRAGGGPRLQDYMVKDRGRSVPTLADFLAGVPRMYVGRMPADASCPYCKKLTYMDYVEDSARIVDSEVMRAEAAFQCANCCRFSVGGMVHAGMSTDQSGASFALRLHADSDPADIARVLIGNVEYWEPVSPVGREYVDVPPEIASPADEAHRCFSIGAFRAAILLARSVVEAIAKARGVTTGVLRQKIDSLAQQDDLRAVLAESAHEIRHVGNDMAHGDFATADVGADDAADVLELMDDIIEEIFAVRSRIERRRARRGGAGA